MWRKAGDGICKVAIGACRHCGFIIVRFWGAKLILILNYPSTAPSGSCGPPPPPGCTGRGGTSEAAPEASDGRLEEVAKAVGGGCCRLTNAIEAGT